MKVITAGDATSNLQPMDPAHFTGRTSSTSLIGAGTAGSMFAAIVRFEAGVRNHWHSHGGGQVLHVVEGEGWVQLRDQPPARIRKGDTVVAAPNEEHWHGAARRGAMAHLAIGMGETRWLEESAAPSE
ncbi:MAG TPA: cupin domain-containing protein [Candidatus Dormibacteraeota bacterium]